MRLLASTALVLVLGVTGAVAADAPDLIIDEDPIELATTGWDGVYIGVGGTYLASINFPDDYAAVRGVIGANYTMDQFLLGAEAYFSWESEIPFPNANNFFIVGGEVRAGFVPSDAILIYGAVGGEADVTNSNVYLTAGGGVEFMVMDSLSLDFEYKYIHEIGGVGYRGNEFGATLNWHF